MLPLWTWTKGWINALSFLIPSSSFLLLALPLPLPVVMELVRLAHSSRAALLLFFLFLPRFLQLASPPPICVCVRVCVCNCWENVGLTRERVLKSSSKLFWKGVPERIMRLWVVTLVRTFHMRVWSLRGVWPSSRIKRVGDSRRTFLKVWERVSSSKRR